MGDRLEMVESLESLRGLIEKLVLNPDAGDGYTIDLRGDLGALLNLATGTKASASKGLETHAVDISRELELVAGVGFEPTTFRL